MILHRRLQHQVFMSHVNPVIRTGRSSIRSNRRGAMAVIIAVSVPMLMIMIAFAIQFTYIDLTRVELRTATDAAAEAGARVLSATGDQGQAITAAKNAAARNLVSGQPFVLQDGDIVFGKVNQPGDNSRYHFVENTTSPNALRVNSQVERPHMFSVLADSLTVGATSVAGQVDRDIALVLDRSGSMVYVTDDGLATSWTNGDAAPSNSRWARLAVASKEFLVTLTKTPMDEKLSLITYNQTAGIDNPLTFTYSGIANSIDSYTAHYVDGATNIADGIEKGRQTLRDMNLQRPWASSTLVVMTDGLHNRGSISPQDAASAAAAQGITIHTVTYGDDANQAAMQEVAQIGGGKHWHAPNGSELKKIFKAIAANLPTMLME